MQRADNSWIGHVQGKHYSDITRAIQSGKPNKMRKTAWTLFS